MSESRGTSVAEYAGVAGSPAPLNENGHIVRARRSVSEFFTDDRADEPDVSCCEEQPHDPVMTRMPVYRICKTSFLRTEA